MRARFPALRNPCFTTVLLYWVVSSPAVERARLATFLQLRVVEIENRASEFTIAHTVNQAGRVISVKAPIIRQPFRHFGLRFVLIEIGFLPRHVFHLG